MRCPECRGGWTSPPLPEEAIASYYPESYLGNTEKTIEEFRSGNLQRSRSWRKETEKVKLLERYQAGGRVLDVGCADGKFLWALDPGRWERWGVEFSARTAELVKREMPGLQILPGDIYHPGLPCNHFQAITLWHVLEHLPRPEKVLARAAALLAEGGLAVISLPNMDSIQAGLFGMHWYGYDDVPRHLYHFSPAALSGLLKEAGFEVLGRYYSSRLLNFHCLKHSLLNWAGPKPAGRWLYYLLKPGLFTLVWAEGLTGRYGIMTVVARKTRKNA